MKPGIISPPSRTQTNDEHISSIWVRGTSAAAVVETNLKIKRQFFSTYKCIKYNALLQVGIMHSEFFFLLCSFFLFVCSWLNFTVSSGFFLLIRCSSSALTLPSKSAVPFPAYGTETLERPCKKSVNPYAPHALSLWSLYCASKTSSMNNGVCVDSFILLMLHVCLIVNK